MRLPRSWTEVHAIDADGIEWPRWVPLALLLPALGTVAISMVQRHALLSPDWASLAFALVAVLPWLLDLTRFRLPLPLFSAVVLGGFAGLAIDPAPADMAPFLLVLLAGQTACISPVVGLATTVAAEALMGVIEVSTSLDDFAPWFFGIAVGWAVGFIMRLQIQVLLETRAAQVSLSEKAAAEERQRIAREIHDVIAHSLSVTLLHLTGARRVLEQDCDVGSAVEGLRDAERLGRQAMADIRRTVGLLAPDGRVETAPLPGVVDIGELVASFAGAGLDVRYEVSGDCDSISPAVGLALYRMAQESLSNVARHSPGARAEVSLDLSTDPILLAVRNGPSNGRTAASYDRSERRGLGLEGMRQRATTLGGALRAGPEGESWLVAVTLPKEAATR